MSGWKCGKCGIMYDTDGLLNLKKIKAVDSDTDPIKQHGFTSVCTCGYVFHKDKWMLVNLIKIKQNNLEAGVRVSTVDLELSHGGYYYETMIFSEDNSKIDLENNYQERYKTKEEAIENHNKVLSLLKKGAFNLKPTRYELELQETANNKKGVD